MITLSFSCSLAVALSQPRYGALYRHETLLLAQRSQCVDPISAQVAAYGGYASYVRLFCSPMHQAQVRRAVSRVNVESGPCNMKLFR